MDCDVWCEKLAQRLPELMWKLPIWPKNYLSQIPSHLFEIKSDWTPLMAIHEVLNHIHRLRELPANSAKANYLSKKILQQIQVLVTLSKKLPEYAYDSHQKKGLTRQDYQDFLHEQVQRLVLQKQALARSAVQSAYQQQIQEEIKKIEHHISELKVQFNKS